MTHPRRSQRRSITATSRRMWTALLFLIALAASASGSRLAATAARDEQNRQPPVTDNTAPTVAQIQNTQPPGTDEIAPSALAQIQAVLAEKATRTPAQQKMDSQLIYAIKMARGQAIAAGVGSLETDLPRESDARVTVDVTADVSDGLLDQVQGMGATVL